MLGLFEKAVCCTWRAVCLLCVPGFFPWKVGFAYLCSPNGVVKVCCVTFIALVAAESGIAVTFILVSLTLSTDVMLSDSLRMYSIHIPRAESMRIVPFSKKFQEHWSCFDHVSCISVEPSGEGITPDSVFRCSRGWTFSRAKGKYNVYIFHP